MGHGLQRAVNAARASRGLPPRVVHLITNGTAGEWSGTACGRLMSKVMRGSRALWDVTCKRCLATSPDRLDLSDETTEG